MRTEKHQNNKNSIVVTLNIEINFMFNFFVPKRSFKPNFVTVLPSPSRRVFHSNCKLTITFINCCFQKI